MKHGYLNKDYNETNSLSTILTISRSFLTDGLNVQPPINVKSSVFDVGLHISNCTDLLLMKKAEKAKTTPSCGTSLSRSIAVRSHSDPAVAALIALPIRAIAPEFK